MNKEEILDQLKRYNPLGVNDERTRDLFLDLINNSGDATNRLNLPGHITSSAIILNCTVSNILLVHHRKLDRWLQPGGHIDNDENLKEASLREVFEETGLIKIQPLLEGIFDLDIHLIPARNSQPAHYHYDVRFLFVNENDEIPVHDPEETLGVDWFSFDRIIGDGFDEAFIRVVKKIRLLNLTAKGK